jgi:hypothetical protein
MVRSTASSCSRPTSGVSWRTQAPCPYLTCQVVTASRRSCSCTPRWWSPVQWSRSDRPSSACHMSGGRSSRTTAMPTWFTGALLAVWITRSATDPPRNSQRSPVRVASTATSRGTVSRRGSLGRGTVMGMGTVCPIRWGPCPPRTVSGRSPGSPASSVSSQPAGWLPAMSVSVGPTPLTRCATGFSNASPRPTRRPAPTADAAALIALQPPLWARLSQPRRRSPRGPRAARNPRPCRAPCPTRPWRRGPRPCGRCCDRAGGCGRRRGPRTT